MVLTCPTLVRDPDLASALTVLGLLGMIGLAGALLITLGQVVSTPLASLTPGDRMVLTSLLAIASAYAAARTGNWWGFIPWFLGLRLAAAVVVRVVR